MAIEDYTGPAMSAAHGFLVGPDGPCILTVAGGSPVRAVRNSRRQEQDMEEGGREPGEYIQFTVTRADWDSAGYSQELATYHGKDMQAGPDSFNVAEIDSGAGFVEIRGGSQSHAAL